MSKWLFFALVSLLAAVGPLWADGEKFATLKVGADVFTNVTVTAVTATDIYFSHNRGLGNAKLKNLDPAMQNQFHFDPAKAAEKEKQQAEARTLFAQAVERAKQAARAGAAASQGGAAGPANPPDEVAPHEISAKSFLNRLAPEVVAEKWLTKPASLSGKFVLLAFWGTWSAPCRGSVPELNAFHNKFKDRLTVVGLADETEAEVRKMTEPKIEYYVAIDPQHRASGAFGVQRVPHLVLIDPKGVVRFEGHPGYLDEKKLEKLLERYAN